MTPEQKKPVNPLQRSPYIIEELDKIPELSQRDEVLEGQEDYYLGYHDILRVTVFGRQDSLKGATDITRETEIRNDGMISYPLVGDIKAAGLTIPQLQQNIVEKLKEYIVAPKVDIQIIKYASRDVSILGEVENPHVIYLRGKTTLLEAIANAGGLTEKANLKGAYIIRKNKIIPIDLYALMTEGDLKYNVEVRRKDIIYIPNVQDQRVYVVGEVKKPMIVPFAGKILRVAEAIASAGDFEISAKKSNIKIIRGGLENPTVITVNFDKITNGDLGENIALYSEDIVYVPASFVGEWNKILKQLTPSLQTLMFGATLDYYINR
ncbi:MAG: SLBB domain-containing protein [Nitrospirota bacterium]|nr:SLBB domain-containing protein [Nitrospirota bacterium]